MLTIYGVTRSRASRLIWLCHEIDRPFTQVPVLQAYRLAEPEAEGAPMNTLSPTFLGLSPAGALPVMDDDGLVLSESMACLLHLARGAGGPVGPQDAAELALIEQWCFFAATAIEPDALTIMFLHGRGQAQAGEDAGLVAASAERLVRPMKVLEDRLALQGNLVARRFTAADIAVAECVRYAQGYAPLMDQFPAVAEWLAACQNRPAFRKMWESRMAEPE